MPSADSVAALRLWHQFSGAVAYTRSVRLNIEAEPTAFWLESPLLSRLT